MLGACENDLLEHLRSLGLLGVSTGYLTPGQQERRLIRHDFNFSRALGGGHPSG